MLWVGPWGVSSKAPARLAHCFGVVLGALRTPPPYIMKCPCNRPWIPGCVAMQGHGAAASSPCCLTLQTLCMPAPRL